MDMNHREKSRGIKGSSWAILCLLVIGLFSSLPSIAQESSYKLFLSEFFIPVDSQNAEYVRELTHVSANQYEIRDYMMNGNLYQKGYVSIERKEDGTSLFPAKTPSGYSEQNARYYLGKHIKQGEFTRYFENGNIAFIGNYVKDNKSGMFQEWYSDGMKKGDFFYYKDSMELVGVADYRVINFFDSLGQQKVIEGEGIYYEFSNGLFYAGGIKEGVKEGEWSGYFNHGKSTFRETYQNGRFVYGVSKDSLGQEYPYEEIMEQPKYGENGLTEFYQLVADQMIYPKKARRRGIEGRVFVQFVVDKEGRTVDIKTVQGIDPECDLQAEQAIANADRFSPGRHRGQLAKFRMVLPVIFKLNN
ncbi:MAG: TonB family protein [Cyclobacteriaceae bacterium]|nr:TonB family protein [Cyclobacteriaceae bacterium]